MFPSHEFCLGAMAPSINTMMSGPILPQPRTLAPIGLPMTDAHIVPGTTAAPSVEVDSVGEGVELPNNSLPVLCLGSLIGFQAVPPLSNFLTLAAKGFKLKRRSPPPPLLEISLDSLNISSAKRARLDTPASINPIASRVVHVRRLPPDVVEMDVAKFAMPFGVILNLVLTKKSGQALIEMTSCAVSGTMIEYYSQHPPSLRGCGPIVFQYSRYQELEIVGISRPVSEAVSIGNEHVRRYVDGVVNRPRIIRAYLESNNSQQLTYMEYFQLFHRYGCILKIIVFKMSGRNQAFIEFASPVSAHVALLQMDGIVLSANQAKLKVEFSRQTSLELRQDDNTSRDFIAQPLSAQEQVEIASNSLVVQSG